MAAPSSSNYNNNNNHNQNVKYAKGRRRKYNDSTMLRNSHESRQRNHEIVHCTSAMEVLKVLQFSLTHIGGGGQLTHVNLSTSLHRICKHTLKQRKLRAQVLSDAQFALLLAVVAKAALQDFFIRGKFPTFPGPWPNCDWYDRQRLCPCYRVRIWQTNWRPRPKRCGIWSCKPPRIVGAHMLTHDSLVHVSFLVVSRSLL